MKNFDNTKVNGWFIQRVDEGMSYLPSMSMEDNSGGYLIVASPETKNAFVEFSVNFADPENNWDIDEDFVVTASLEEAVKIMKSKYNIEVSKEAMEAFLNVISGILLKGWKK